MELGLVSGRKNYNRVGGISMLGMRSGTISRGGMLQIKLTRIANRDKFPEINGEYSYPLWVISGIFPSMNTL